MGVPKVEDDFEFCGLTVEHIREIIDLILDGRETNKKDIELKIHVLKPNVYTAYRGERLTINIPTKFNKTDDEFFKYGQEIHIFDNGHFAYENGMGVQIGYNNPLQIYKILVDNFKPAQQ